VAGASSVLLGLIGGLADFSVSSLNYLAGWLSDRSGKRKGYAFGAHKALNKSGSVLCLLTTPTVTVLSKPNGEPMANTQEPMRMG